MNDNKQLECQLNCKATAKLEESIAEDMRKGDGCLKELIQGKEENEETKDDTETSS